jgi:lysophospholipase L1-like esterase
MTSIMNSSRVLTVSGLLALIALAAVFIPKISGRQSAEPPPELAAWVDQDRLDPPEPGSLVFIGSSSIRRWESLTRDFADYKVVQRGWGGSLLAEMDTAFPHIVAPYQPAAIVMWAGANDLSAGRSGTQVHQDFLTFLHMLRREMPDTPFFYLGMTPNPANRGTTAERQTANRLIRASAKADPHTHFVDLATAFEKLGPEELDRLYVDPLHLNQAGYAKWLGIVRPAIAAVIPPNKPLFANPSAPAAGSRLLFDFGPDNDGLDGRRTPSPDPNGHHWNHWFAVPGNTHILAGEHQGGIVDSAGKPTGVRWTITGGYRVNGRRHGGLFAPDGPDPELLGELAVESATEDFFFSTADDLTGGGDDDLPGGFMLAGLDPALVHEFRFFGSRNHPAVHRTRFTVHGRTRHVAVLQSSGKNLGGKASTDANDHQVLAIPGVRPDAFGQVFVDMLLLEGELACINAMEIRVVAAE